MDEVKKQTKRTSAERETEEIAEEARRLFFYHAETGLILRRCYWKGANIGEEAGGEFHGKDGQIYRLISVCNSRFRSHRIAWLLHYGEWPLLNIDHRDGNGLNNRIANLREATVQQNGMNLKMSSKNTSGVTGVSFKKSEGRWIAAIALHQKQIHLGYFRNFEDAVKARKEAEKKYGFSERHGTKKATLVPPTASDRIP
jgi:hypothetical protein